MQEAVGEEEVLAAFVAAWQRGERLVGWLRRYPQYEAALVAAALELSGGPGVVDNGAALAAVQAALRRAMDVVLGAEEAAGADGPPDR